jgi:hypothetical protein
MPTMTGAYPSGTRGFMVEIETAASPHTAVMGTRAGKRRLRRPGERALFVGEAGKVLDDCVDGAHGCCRGLRLHCSDTPIGTALAVPQSADGPRGFLALRVRFSSSAFTTNHEKAVPQGLKPTLAWAQCGTAKAVPFLQDHFPQRRSLIYNLRMSNRSDGRNERFAESHISQRARDMGHPSSWQGEFLNLVLAHPL